MRTTIVVENGGAATVTGAEWRDATTPVPEGPAVSAGPAPNDRGDGNAAAPTEDAADGGPPPGWLVDAIAAAGGGAGPGTVGAPASTNGGGRTALDGGAALV